MNIGDIIPFGGYNWRVLAVRGKTALLITEDIIEQRAYHSIEAPVTWEKCDLRKYLNAEFYNKLGEAKSKVLNARNKNQKNPEYGTKGGNPTNDKIFLLSINEAKKYFTNDSESIANIDGEACWWWLRSPGNLDCRAADIFADGGVNDRGRFINESGGVRPTLWIKIK